MTVSTGRKPYVLAAAALLAAAMLYGMVRGGGPIAIGYGGGDTTPPKTTLSAPSSERFTNSGTVSVTVRCNEACRATGQARVSTPGAAKVFRSGKATKQLAANNKVKLEPKFSAKATKAIRSALAKKQLTAKVTVGTKDSAGNKTTRTRNVKLKR